MMTTVPGPAAAAAAAPAAPPPGRRRRPSGEPPPLARHHAPHTTAYAVVLGAMAALSLALLTDVGARAVTRVDLAMLRPVTRLRSPVAIDVAKAIEAAGDHTVIRVAAWATIAVLIAFRRFQHLVTYLIALLAVSFVETGVANQVARMRPAGIRIVGVWQGYSHPSRPIAGLGVVLAGAVCALAPAGSMRRRGTRVAVIVLVLVAAARLYLAVDHPSDVIVAVGLGWLLPLLGFGLAAPDDAFPVTYRRGVRAHIDIGGRRGDAIRLAVRHQLGLELTSVEPFGLEGSAGSTPLRVVVRDGAGRETVMFAKLYALNHLRSDRLYKLMRSIRYGRLEDERSFSTVRRLVEYEDHLLRVFADAGVPAPRPGGLVEISPEREYLILMEFFAGAHELTGVALTEGEIDQGLSLVRKMWDAGLAHRDIKPSNVLVHDGRLILIDVAFAALRPSPWRQAVDLANMMLTLGLGSTADIVYRRALCFFTPDDVAEAFAASRGVTIPARLRAAVHDDDRQLDAAFRALAPPRRRIPVQRWTWRRLASTVAVGAAAAMAVWVGSVYAHTAGLL